jgi:hypothetical protein
MYRDTQAAIIAALADHARPVHARWQDQYRPGYWDVPTIAALRNSLVGMEEVAGPAALVMRHMLALSDLHLAILIVRYETQFPSARHQASLEYVTQASAEAVTGLSNRRLRQAIIRATLSPGRAKVRPKLAELADRYGVHRKTVERHYSSISQWAHAQFDRAMAEMTDRLEARGLIEHSEPETPTDPGMIEKLRQAMRDLVGA